jgi:hypothetical protein
MKIMKSVVLIWLATSLHSFGAVEATLFHISTNATFTVPTGKVLIIESTTYLSPALRLQKATNSFDLNGDGDGALRLRLPLKVPEGWTLQAVDTGFESTDVWIFGLLVAPSDLFASLRHRIDAIDVSGATALLSIQTASPRPALINVEKSPEADKGWHAAENAVVTPTTNKTSYVASVPIEGDKEFFRTKARPRVR